MELPKKHIFAVVVVCLLLIFSLAHLVNRTNEQPVSLFSYEDAFKNYDKSIKVAVEYNFYPMSYFTDRGHRLTGFDPKITHLLCRTMEIKCEIVPMAFNKIADALAQDEVQMAVAGMSRSPEREAIMAFSDPYYRTKAMFVSRDQHISFIDFNDHEFFSTHIIGVQDGSIHLDFLLAHLPQHKNSLKIFKYPDDLKQALFDSEVDLVFVDSSIGYDILKNLNYGDFNEIPFEETEQIKHFRNVCITVGKKNSEQLKYINKALQDIRLSGDYNKVSSDYFSYL